MGMYKGCGSIVIIDWLLISGSKTHEGYDHQYDIISFWLFVPLHKLA